MTDSCEHCVVKGDVEICKKTGCPTVNSWIVKELLKRIKELEE